MKTELALLLVYDGPTMSLDQVAELMGIKERSLENQHYAGTCPIPLFKIGNKLNAHIADVAAYIDEQRAKVLKEQEAANSSGRRAA